MTEEEAEEMIKGLLKRINEKDQVLHELQMENVRLGIENGKLKAEIERLKAIIHEMGSEFPSS